MVVSSSPELTAELPPGDLRQVLLYDRLARSRSFQAGMLAYQEYSVDGAVLVPLGNGFDRYPTIATKIKGSPLIACPVFEDVALAEKNAHKLREYDDVVVASSWNRAVLEQCGISSHLCHEGIDPEIFNPGVRRKRDDGRFRVFSGGKAEYRKGHDLVIEAFKLFAKLHDDAVLVACWSSPFGGLASDLEKTSVGSPPGHHIGRPNFHAWLQKNGLKPHQFEIVSPRPNWRMAEVYGSCDVALFPNRCEGGTNFVAMECMACGVPVILLDEFGQKDLQEWRAPATFVQCPDDAAPHWYSYHLGNRYDSRDSLGSPPGNVWTWERHCRAMAEIVDAA